MVVAGPGSGKTRTLVERARTLLASESSTGIAFVTFTRTSRRDTKKKLEEVLGQDTETQAQNYPRVSTLHGFAKSILHKAPKVVGLDPDFSVLVPEKEQELVLREVVEDLSLNISKKALRKAIASQKNTGTLEVLGFADPAKLLQAAARYETLCRFYNATDIEGLVNAATKVIKERRATLPSLYFHADEYQDLNHADQELVRALLASGTHSVVIVGDDDQSIYGFRDARPEGIREIFADQEWEKVVFPKCHRLPPHILRASQALIKHHRGPRLDKGIEIPKDDGRRIATFVCTTDAIEIEFIAELIGREKKESEKQGKKLLYKDFMILCPTRVISNTFAKHLKEAWNIPVRKIAPRTIPDELWGILLVLRIAKRDDNLALRQWLEYLELSSDEIRQLRDRAFQQMKSLFEIVRQAKDKRLQRLVKELGKLRTQRDDLVELLKTAKFLAGVTKLPFETKAKSLTAIISELYEEYGLLDREEADTKSDEVLVTTLHSSKGLEARVVFIVQLSSRHMPSPGRDADEELRVLYVGMTRAKQELYLSCPYLFDPARRRKMPLMSPFLKLINPHLSIQKVSRRKSQKRKKQW